MKVLTDDQLAALNEVQHEVKTMSEVPLGYVAIELSTKGKVGAPKIFHIRNFRTTDLVSISLTSQDDLPETMCNLLDDMIFEKNVSVRNWHEKEVTELIVRLYMIYFSPILENIDFEPLEEDWEFLKNEVGEERYLTMRDDFMRGNWVPKTTINLTTIETHDLDDRFNSILKLSSKKTGLSATFTYPKYGDVIFLRKFLKVYFEKDTKKFATIRRSLEIKNELERRAYSGEEIDLANVPYVSEMDLKEYSLFESNRSVVAVDVVRCLNFLEFDGKDLSELPFEEKLNVSKDPRVDYTLSKKVEDYYAGLKFGINSEEIKMYNPITRMTVTRGYSFRLVDILQAIGSFESDEYDIVTNT
jgi:hypothetical protein